MHYYMTKFSRIPSYKLNYSIIVRYFSPTSSLFWRRESRPINRHIPPVINPKSIGIYFVFIKIGGISA